MFFRLVYFHILVILTIRKICYVKPIIKPRYGFLTAKMNYYNTGFIGGFLYNLKVEAMDQPKGYSKEAISEITQKYQKLAETKTVPSNEQPNIVFVMSESFQIRSSERFVHYW